MVSCTLVTKLSGKLEYSQTRIKEYSIPFQVPGSKADRELLHYYCCQTAGDLSSSLDGDFWTHLILQRGHVEPVIRNALITLSSLHKDYVFDELQKESTNPGEIPVHRARNLSLVARSHRQLRNYLFRTDALLEVALICSVIFYSFESLLGEPARAIEHLDHGLTLLKQSQAQVASQISDDGLTKRLITLYQRLDIQASSFEDRRRPILTLVTLAERTGSSSVVPPLLRDNGHAEVVLTKLQNWALHHIIGHVEMKSRPWDEFSPHILHERRILATQYDRYGYALERFCVQSGINSQWLNSVKRQEQTNHFLFLQTQFLLFRALLSENLPSTFWAGLLLPSEGEEGRGGESEEAEASQAVSPFLTFSSDPNNSLRHALSNLMNILSTKNGRPKEMTAQTMSSTITPTPSSQTPSPESQRRTFSLSSQIVSVLFFTCVKTTDPEILSCARAAISSLRGRDGLWDAETVSFIVEELVQINTRSEHSDLSMVTSPISEEESQQSANTTNPSAVDLAYCWDQSCAGSEGNQSSMSEMVKPMPNRRLEDSGFEVIDADGGLNEIAKLLHGRLRIRAEDIEI